MTLVQSRRRFLATLSSSTAAAVIGASNSAAQDAPPETTTIRLAKNAGICIAPQYLADELLRAEGFTDIRYGPAAARRALDWSRAARRTSTMPSSEPR